jgi:hypothetical protein
MLVLAMEFSRGAQRLILDAEDQTEDRSTGADPTGERPTTTRGRGGIAWR